MLGWPPLMSASYSQRLIDQHPDATKRVVGGNEIVQPCHGAQAFGECVKAAHRRRFRGSAKTTRQARSRGTSE